MYVIITEATATKGGRKGGNKKVSSDDCVLIKKGNIVNNIYL